MTLAEAKALNLTDEQIEAMQKKGVIEKELTVDDYKSKLQEMEKHKAELNKESAERRKKIDELEKQLQELMTSKDSTLTEAQKIALEKEKVLKEKAELEDLLKNYSDYESLKTEREAYRLQVESLKNVYLERLPEDKRESLKSLELNALKDVVDVLTSKQPFASKGDDTPNPNAKITSMEQLVNWNPIISKVPNNVTIIGD